MTIKDATIKYDGLTANGVPTTLAVVRCQEFARGLFTVENPDVSQTLSVYIYRRPTPDAEMAVSDYEGFLNIGPNTPRCNDLDITGAYEIEFRGVANGAGITGIEIHGSMQS